MVIKNVWVGFPLFSLLSAVCDISYSRICLNRCYAQMHGVHFPKSEQPDSETKHTHTHTHIHTHTNTHTHIHTSTHTQAHTHTHTHTHTHAHTNPHTRKHTHTYHVHNRARTNLCGACSCEPKKKKRQ